jgi:hypothetical protein
MLSFGHARLTHLQTIIFVITALEAGSLNNPLSNLTFFACGEPAISLLSHHVSLVQWTTCLLPATRDTGSNPLGGLM